MALQDILNQNYTNINIPSRQDSACTGTDFVNNNNFTGQQRNDNIFAEISAGNIPDFLRTFIPVTITENNNSITYFVMSDSLAIGSNDDYLRIPMTPLTAQQICDAFDCTLPTVKMVNDIWANAEIKLPPHPRGSPYDNSMLLTTTFKWHNDIIQVQLNGMDHTKLISGHKKDIVLTNKLSPNNPNKRVAIYGWILSNGNPIQQLNPVSHESLYYDYSHQARLISNDVIVNNNIMKIQDVFQNASLCNLISNESILTFLNY